jgi:hypothetical protein
MTSKRGNGEGSRPRKRPDGRWEARYTIHTSGRPKRKTLYGRTRQQVADKLSRALSDRAQGLLDNRINLSPYPILNPDNSVRVPALDNHGMGTIFEELIRPSTRRITRSPASLYPQDFNNGFLLLRSQTFLCRTRRTC